MTAPADRIYCGDLWCDGDHLSSTASCDDQVTTCGECGHYLDQEGHALDCPYVESPC